MNPDRTRIVEALAVMDGKGRRNPEGNSYMLWEKDWNCLRRLLLALAAQPAPAVDVAEVVEVLGRCLRECEIWRAEAYCDCEGASHQCGVPRLEVSINRARALIARLDAQPEEQAGEGLAAPDEPAKVPVGEGELSSSEERRNRRKYRGAPAPEPVFLPDLDAALRRAVRRSHGLTDLDEEDTFIADLMREVEGVFRERSPAPDSGEGEGLRERVEAVAREQDRRARQAREIGRDEGNADAWEVDARNHEMFAEQIRAALEAELAALRNPDKCPVCWKYVKGKDTHTCHDARAALEADLAAGSEGGE